jgi:hypothetical protein
MRYSPKLTPVNGCAGQGGPATAMHL